MKRGFSNTILTPNDKVWSGTRATHHAQRKQEWANQNHTNLFFRVKALFVRNSCLQDKQLINSTIMRSLNNSEKGFIVSGQRFRTLDAASLQFSLSHCHLREWIFGQKRYFNGSTATILTWSESMWLFSFPKTQIPHQRSSFWNCGQHAKGCDRPAEGTSTWRLPALLLGVGATSLAVCGFPRELLWRG